MDTTFTLLESRFFLNLEEGNETDIKVHYEDIRKMIVAFVHGKLHWRIIHTGLTMFISEVTHLVSESVCNTLAGYGRRILEIAKGLLHQLELLLESGNNETETVSESALAEKQNKVRKKVKLTAKYTAVCEIINMIISMNMINGGDIPSNEVINRVHELFGLNYSTDKYYKTRGEIIRRCPEDGCRPYFIKAALEVLKCEYANA